MRRVSHVLLACKLILHNTNAPFLSVRSLKSTVNALSEKFKILESVCNVNIFQDMKRSDKHCKLTVPSSYALRMVNTQTSFVS